MALLAGLLLACGGKPESSRMSGGGGDRAAQPAETLRVDRAGSLDGVIRLMAARFQAAHPEVVVVGQRGGSVDLARRARDPSTTPDVLALADYAIIPRLLVPRHASWYAAFARNAMVVAYTSRSAHAQEINADNWAGVLLRPGARTGHSDPARDPRLQSSLRRRLRLSTISSRTAGWLDYVMTYRSSARARGLRTIELPPEINLSDPALAATYAEASLEVAREPGAADSVVIRGEPILYGVTVPNGVVHRELAEQFVRQMLSPAGQALLRESGFLLLDHPISGGRVPQALQRER